MGVTPLTERLRPPIVDGLFYPSKREALGTLVDQLMAASPTPRGASPAVISPHAGYEYAGPVMAAAYRAVALRPVRVAVVLGPVHRDAEDGVFLPESEAYSTPFGEIPVDGEAVAALCAADPVFHRDDIPHLEEHCIEVQLPFLARLFPGLAIVPILVGGGGAPVATAVAAALRSVFSTKLESTVFVMTANMASYMTGRDIEAEGAALEDLLTGCDWRGVIAAAKRKQISACGSTGIAALLSFLGSNCHARILARGSSRGEDADESRIVQYAAVSLERSSYTDTRST
jgi:AmmeMemoRadiSam system protein B